MQGFSCKVTSSLWVPVALVKDNLCAYNFSSGKDWIVKLVVQEDGSNNGRQLLLWEGKRVAVENNLGLIFSLLLQCVWS